MSAPEHLSVEQARRIAVRAQWLADPRPDNVVATVRHLGAVQADLTARVAPSADLVLHSRIPGYRPTDLEALIDGGQIIELHGMLRPAEDLSLFLDQMRNWPRRSLSEQIPEGDLEVQDWVEANEAGRRDILAALRSDGPMSAAELPDGCDVPWRSSGWTNNKNVQRMVGFMVQRGEVALVGREARIPLYDLAERVYPDVEAVPMDEALRILAERRLHALGIARPRTAAYEGEPHAEGLGIEATVEGQRGTWRVDPAWLDDAQPPFEGRTVLISPLDRLIFDRKRMETIFAFDYQLEMYKPEAKRRWGYYALPILHGERLVGKVDAKGGLERGVLRVNAIHEDEPFCGDLQEAVQAELVSLAEMLELEVERL